MLSPFFPQTHFRPALTAFVVIGVYLLVRRTQYLWHWVYLAFTLVAFQQMDWFKPAVKDHHFENIWIQWDRALLYDWHFKGLLEFAGPSIPYVLEAAYLLVYAVGPVSVAILYMCRRDDHVRTLLLYYQGATLVTYAFFPFSLRIPAAPPIPRSRSARYGRRIARFQQFAAEQLLHSQQCLS